MVPMKRKTRRRSIIMLSTTDDCAFSDRTISADLDAILCRIKNKPWPAISSPSDEYTRVMNPGAQFILSGGIDMPLRIFTACASNWRLVHGHFPHQNTRSSNLTSDE